MFVFYIQVLVLFQVTDTFTHFTELKTKTNGLKADCSHPVALETVFFCNADSKRICQPIEDALGSRKLGYAKQEVVTSAC